MAWSMTVWYSAIGGAGKGYGGTRNLHTDLQKMRHARQACLKVRDFERKKT